MDCLTCGGNQAVTEGLCRLCSEQARLNGLRGDGIRLRGPSLSSTNDHHVSKRSRHFLYATAAVLVLVGVFFAGKLSEPIASQGPNYSSTQQSSNDSGTQETSQGDALGSVEEENLLYDCMRYRNGYLEGVPGSMFSPWESFLAAEWYGFTGNTTPITGESFPSRIRSKAFDLMWREIVREAGTETMPDISTVAADFQVLCLVSASIQLEIR